MSTSRADDAAILNGQKRTIHIVVPCHEVGFRKQGIGRKVDEMKKKCRTPDCRKYAVVSWFIVRIT